MSDALLRYKAAMSPDSIYGMIGKWQDDQEYANFCAANEFMDFKEFLIDVYMDGGFAEFKECYLKFMRWQTYTDEEIKEMWPELLEDE